MDFRSVGEAKVHTSGSRNVRAAVAEGGGRNQKAQRSGHVRVFVVLEARKTHQPTLCCGKPGRSIPLSAGSKEEAGEGGAQ